jgi:hypothetical protein
MIANKNREVILTLPLVVPEINVYRNSLRMALPCLMLCALGYAGLAQESSGQKAESITFYAMGDVPYTAEQEHILQRQISELPDDGQFVIHVGDIKAGAPPCEETVYAKVSGMLAESATPLFIIPGDNEWNDCVDPAQGWVFWQKYFRRFDQRWQHRLPVFRQLEREENFSLVINDVLFIGINIVGGRVHDADEWTARHAQDMSWVRDNLHQFGQDVHSLVLFGHAAPAKQHQDFFTPFSEAAQAFAKPVLYIHGDGHKWIEDRPFTAKNILRIQVDQGGIAPPLKVTIHDRPTETFVFDRRK